MTNDEIKQLREWAEGVEADNDTLRKEILNLRAELDKIRNLAFSLNDEVKELCEKSAQDDRTILRLESQYGVQYDRAEKLHDRAEKLLNERDAARRNFCNASYDDPYLVARELGWDCFEFAKPVQYFCDHCGDKTDSDNVFHYAELPQDIASANKGESATVCRKCNEMIEANANNKDFRTTDME